MQIPIMADSIAALAYAGLPAFIYVPQAQYNTQDNQYDSTAGDQPAHW
jgi:hypothetical protein